MNEQLEQLEFQLAEMPTIQRIGVYLFLIIALTFASWNFFGEDLDLEIESKIEEVQTLEKKLQKNSIKSLERNIKKAKKEVLILEDSLSEARYQDQYIRSKLESMDFIFCDQIGIATVLDKVLKSSLNYGINISLIETEKEHIGFSIHVIEKEKISIKGTGSFKSIMGLIQYIDSFKTLLRIKEITIGIDKNEDTSFIINILLYGVEF